MIIDTWVQVLQNLIENPVEEIKYDIYEVETKMITLSINFLK